MYIAPNGMIKLLRDVPLEPTYEHTLYWENAAAQEAYFSSKAKYTYTRQSYQRIKRNYINISVPPENLFDCNYLMYTNNRIGNKWFYAFIKSVDYVNEGVTQVVFEIDVMQTWFFDYRLGECFVEREHSATDHIGDNLIEENLPIGDYVYEDATVVRTDYTYDSHGEPISATNKTLVGNLFKQDKAYISGENYENDFSICIAAPFHIIWTGDTPAFSIDASPGYYGGCFAGLYYNLIPMSNVDRLVNLQVYMSHGLAHMTEARRKEIVAIFIVPTSLTIERSIAPMIQAPVCGVRTRKDYAWQIHFGAGESAAPKNNKLYTYPYNKLYVTSSDGGNNDYRYEWFKGSQNDCNLVAECALGVPPQAALTPLAYAVETLSDPTNRSYNFSMFLNNFPMCSWTTDSFRAWLAQNAGKIGVGIATAVATQGLSAKWAGLRLSAVAESESIRANLVRSSANIAAEQRQLALHSSIASTIVDTLSATQQPDQAQGVSRGIIGYNCNEFGFHFYHARIRDEYAHIIDEYFTRFGYATKVNKVPNRAVRERWTYTKTMGCFLTGSVPSDDGDKICAIYDNGITFWKNPNDVGNYELSNLPLSAVEEEQNG